MEIEDKATIWWNALEYKYKRLILDKYKATMCKAVQNVTYAEIKEFYIQEAGYLDGIHGF